MAAEIWSSPIILFIALVYAIFEVCRLTWTVPYQPKQPQLTWQQRFRLRHLYLQQPSGSHWLHQLIIAGLISLAPLLLVALSIWILPPLISCGALIIWAIGTWVYARKQLFSRRAYWLQQREQSPFTLIDDDQTQGRLIQLNRLMIAIIIAVLDYGWLNH